MVRRATIVVRLSEESVENTTEELEKLIREGLRERPIEIPFLEEVEKVTVTEA